MILYCVHAFKLVLMYEKYILPQQYPKCRLTQLLEGYQCQFELYGWKLSIQTTLYRQTAYTCKRASKMKIKATRLLLLKQQKSHPF